MPKSLLFSVTHKDCEMQTFRAGGPGGQNQNKRNSGVRYIHRPSGAKGESREYRTQHENRRAAFKRMGETKEFKTWVRKEAARLNGIETEVSKWVNEQMDPKYIKEEYYTP